MDVFLGLALLVSLGCLAVGLVRPSLFRLASRKSVGARFGFLSLVLFVIIGNLGDVPASPTPNSAATPDVVPVSVEEPALSEVSTGETEDTVPEPSQPVFDTSAPSSTAIAVDESAGTMSEQAGEGTFVSVVEVVDGDTIKVSVNGKAETIRLIGIDTPETKDPRKPVQCFGEEASKKASELLSGRRVSLEADATQGERDKYGRLLRYVRRDDGLFFNEWMIRNGYAHEYTYNLPYKYQADFKAAEQYASANDVGLWSPATCDGDTTSTVTVTADNVAGAHMFYTSSHPSAKYFYCDTDPGWAALSKSYLKSFGSKESLLAAYPTRTLHEACE